MKLENEFAINDASPSGSNVTVCVKHPQELSQKERELWAQFRASNPALYSPYFHLDYTDLVASLRDDVQVVVVYGGDDALAFLPFQGRRVARPVGAPMTDYHGFIKAPETQILTANILQQAGIGAYHFSALVGKHEDISPQVYTVSAAIDVSVGAKAWREAQDASYTRHLKNCQKKARRSEREHGLVTLDSLSRNRETFDMMIHWKHEQFKTTGKYDVLSKDWTLNLLTRLWERGPQAELRCDMFALRVGGQLAAINMGLSDGKTYHSWMVSYNPELSHLSPGMQLLEKQLDASDTVGYNILDLGVGIEGYKRSYHGMDITTGQGFIATRGATAALVKAYGAAEGLLEKSSIGAISKAPGKLRRRYTQIADTDLSASGRIIAMTQAFKAVG